MLKDLGILRRIENNHGVIHIKTIVSSDLVERSGSSLRAEIDACGKWNVRGVEHAHHILVETTTNHSRNSSRAILDELNASVSDVPVRDGDALHQVLVELDIGRRDFIDTRTIVVARLVEVSSSAEVVGWDNNCGTRAVLQFRISVCEVLKLDQLRVNRLKCGLAHDLHLEVTELSIEYHFCHFIFLLV